ncbi:hypothetical protein ACF3NG_06925 [Aerococcaceae bacterium WGS1372]
MADGKSYLLNLLRMTDKNWGDSVKQKTEFMRVEKTKNYSVISNEFIRRKDLSWKAKGILTYILTLPDDWVINIKEVMTHATEGEKAFRSGWKELKDAGYVNRYPVRDKKSNKITHWETVIRESVDTKGIEPLTQNVHVQNVHVQNVQVQKVDVQNDKLLSTNNTKDLTIPSTNNTNIDLENDFEKLWQLYPNKKGKAKALTAYKKAIKDGVTNKQIQDGIVAYKKEIELKRTAPEFIAYGSTWFNNKRWEDDYEINTQRELGHTQEAPKDKKDLVYDSATLKLVNELIESGEREFSSFDEHEQNQLNNWREDNGYERLVS